MTAVLVDSNVLLDLMTEDTRWLSWSAEAVKKAADRFRLVINPIIYAEVSIRYSRIEHLEAALPKAMFDREAIPYEAAFLAGKFFLFTGNEGERSDHRFRLSNGSENRAKHIVVGINTSRWRAFAETGSRRGRWLGR